VLLDEADVFLEERSLADMQRNALVSGRLIRAFVEILRIRFKGPVTWTHMIFVLISRGSSYNRDAIMATVIAFRGL
jgi:hypothetical protein